MSTSFSNDFSEEIWQQKYKFGNDQTIDDTHRRVASYLASVENDPEYWTEQFISILKDFQFVPGGRIISNAGTGLAGTSMLNCFHDGFRGTDQDSIEGIYEAVTNQAKILKTEGGYGFCCNVMRPAGNHIAGIGSATPGPVKFLELWDKSSEIITAGSTKGEDRKDKKASIRKGAQMVTMSDWHPDIEEFITAKATPGKLTRFNMSILCSDALMKAIENDDDWQLVFPNHYKYKYQYEEQWNGDINKWKSYIDKNVVGDTSDSIIIHKTLKARDLWNLITKNAYNRNEPGVIFVDTINRMNNLYWCETILGTNPCGEVPLPIGGVCLLGSLNLVRFIKPDERDWDYDKLKKVIRIAVRLMDNVNDLTNVPLEDQKENLVNKRRIGMGVLGYASALLMARIKYGSPKAIEMTDKLMSFIVNTAYKASSYIAKEKEPFKLFDKKKYLHSEFVYTVLEPDTIQLIKEYGIRNSHLLSIAPTGHTSILSNVVSGGLEPIFAPEYIRTSIQASIPNGLEIPTEIDWLQKTGNFDNNVWSWTKEGDENLLKCKFNNKIWKFDQNRGLTKEEKVEDYGVTYLKQNNLWDANKRWAACSRELSTKAHLDTVEVFAKYVDASVSKTMNVAKDCPFEDFQDIFWQAWEKGIKGFTVYREGTMATVLKTEKAPCAIPKTRAPSRPKVVPCDVHHISVKGKQYFVLVGLLEGEPYEIFAGRNNILPRSIKSGQLTRKRRNYYVATFDDSDLELSPITAFLDDMEETITRLTSMSLRHGADILFLVQQLEKVGGEELHNFAKSMSRALKKYIPDGTKDIGEICPECGQDTMIRVEGCQQCTSCGFSKCI